MVDSSQWRQAPRRGSLGRVGEVGLMNDTFTIDLKKIERPSPQTSDALILRRLTQKLDRATAKVEKHWEELSSEEREAYTHFAYVVIEHPDEEQNKVRRLLDRSRSAWNLFLIALKGEQEAYVEYKVAGRRLVEVILDAVERENLAYQETLTETLEAELSEFTGESMTVEEARERRRQLRHQVHE